MKKCYFDQGSYKRKKQCEKKKEKKGYIDSFFYFIRPFFLFDIEEKPNKWRLSLLLMLRALFLLYTNDSLEKMR